MVVGLTKMMLESVLSILGLNGVLYIDINFGFCGGGKGL